MLIPILVVVAALGFVGTAYAQTPTANGTATAAPAVARRYAVTLLNSFEPIPDSMMPSGLDGLRVYRSHNVVFGKTIYFVRAGFFATGAEAEAARQRLRTRYPAGFVTEITPDEYAQVAGTSPAPAVVPPATTSAVTVPAAKPAGTPTQLYAITLIASTNGAPTPVGPLPRALAANSLYLLETARNGKVVRTLNLGFFKTRVEAERARRQLLASYPGASVRTASSQERETATRDEVEMPASSPPTLVAPERPLPNATIAGTGSLRIEQEATRLMDRARDALTRGDNPAAAQFLLELLRLPPNRQSRDAQELIGLAYERMNAKAKAQREYQLYLKLYTEGEGTERVRQRLANLDAPTATPTLKTARKKDVNVVTAYGSLAQYYYHGDTRAETTTTVGPVINTATLTATDQSALITSLDFTGRARSGDWDNRIVVRDNYTVDFLDNRDNFNRLYSAYGEVRNKTYDYGARIGRQPGNTGGVLGRFDGISAGYGFMPKWRLNVVAGEPVEFNPIDSDRLFLGANLDFGTFAEHWNGNLYYLYQTVDDITDRQAVGAEIRYFDPSLSMLLLTDYDTSFDELNIAMLQGTWQYSSRTTFNVLADHRRAPVLQTSNAVIGETDTSIDSQLRTLTEDQLRQQAVDRTPLSDLLMVGATHNFTRNWQLGGDVKLYNISSTPASGTLPAMTGTGNVLVYTLQGIGNSVFSRSDVSVLSLSYIDSRNYQGESVSLSNRTVLRGKWTLDFSLRYYQQQDNMNSDLSRLTPMLRIGYRWGEHMSFETEGGVEKTTISNTTQTDESTRRFWMLGYRWDF